jgi:subtilisin family serine protease
MMMSRFRRFAPAVSKPFESLEDRRLLSTSPLVSLDWNGQSVQARSGEWILGLDAKSGLVRGKADSAQIKAVERRLSTNDSPAQVEEYLGAPGQFLLDVPQSVSYDQVLTTTKQLPGFQYLEPNSVLQLQSTAPNDPYLSYDYGLDNPGTVPFDTRQSLADADIDAPEAWDVTTGSRDVVVAIVDSGVDYTHPDLAANLWHNPGETPGDGIDNDHDGYVDDVYGINSITGSGDPMDENGHGTHVAGTIGAVGNNGVGVSGVNWNVQIMALKFLAADGSGATADAIKCLNYATAMRQRGVNVKLTSNSWGGGGYEQALRDAIARTASAGMLFVAAAGNDGSDNDATGSYPASYDVPNVVSVAATDRFDALADFSNYGAATVDLAAPGVDIVSTLKGGGYGFMSGTSMATPHVSGVAALAWSADEGATYQEIKAALLAGVDKLPALDGVVATGGRLNALGTIRALPSSVSGTVFDDSDGDGTRGSAELGIAGRTVYLDANNNGAADSAAITVASANVPVAIPDLSTATSTLSVAGLSGVVTDVNVNLGLTHTYDSDLSVFLSSPSGQTVQLLANVGAGGANFTGTVLDDEATAAIGSAAAPFTGRFKPQGSLSDFDGSAPNGTWKLTVTDNGRYDVGTIRSWSIALTAGDVTATTGASGNYVFRNLPQGQTVVRQVMPAGWAATSPAAGYQLLDVTGGQTLTGRDFGARLLPAPDANDEISEASGHAVGYYVNSAIDNATDVDVYGFDVVAGQRVGFNVDAPAGSTLDSYVGLFNGAGSQLAANDNGAAPGEALATQSYFEYTFGAAGRYFVAVSGAPNEAYDVLTGNGDVAGSTGAYTLALANRTVGTDADDQLGEARPLPVGSTTAAESVSNSADVDMFRFTVTAGQRIGFDVDNTAGSALNSYLRVFDASGRQLVTNENGAAPGETLGSASYVEFTFAAAGTYFVGVSGSPNRAYLPTSGNGDTAGSTGGYTLTLTNRTAPATGAAVQPTVSELRAARLASATVFSEKPVSVGEELVSDEVGAVLDVLDATA